MRTALLLALLLFTTGTALAQEDDRFDRSRLSSAAYYNYAEMGEITVTAQVLGTVRYPGLYEVPVGTTFSALLAVSGGPQIDARPRQNKRTVTVSLYRFSSGERRLVKKSEATNGLDVEGADPVIEAGDILVVDTVIRQGIQWRDVFPIVGAIASVTLIIERLVN